MYAAVQREPAIDINAPHFQVDNTGYFAVKVDII